MKNEIKANNKAIENNTTNEPITNLCCFVSLKGVFTTDLESVFLFKGAVFVVFAILACKNTYKKYGTYIIKPTAIAVIAAKNTAPAAMSFMNPIFS